MTAYPLVTPGAGRPAQGFYQYAWIGHEWDDLSDRTKTYNITMPDADTLRLELRPGDQMAFDVAAKSGSERCEIAASYDGSGQVPAGPGRIPVGIVARVKFGLTLEPGPTNSAKWCVLFQQHTDETPGTSPPVGLDLVSGSDRLMLNLGYVTAARTNINRPVWFDTVPLVRGREYSIELFTLIDPTKANGRVLLLKDGAVACDYRGPLGYSATTGTFAAFCVYRHGPGRETLAARYRQALFAWGDSISFPVSEPSLVLKRVEGPFRDGTCRVTVGGTGRPGASMRFMRDGVDSRQQSIVTADGAYSYRSLVEGDGTRHVITVVVDGVASRPLSLHNTPGGVVVMPE